MCDGAASEYGPVVNVGLTCDADIADEDAVVADRAVMCHMGVRHEKGVAAHLGHTLAAGLGATVDGSAFADVHTVADLDISHLAVELEVLRDGTYDSSGEHVAVLSYLYIVEDGRMREDLRSLTYLYEFVDICVWSDLDAVSQFCVWMHASKWMDFCHGYFIASRRALAALVLIECPDLYPVTFALKKPPTSLRSPMRSSSL